MRPGRESFDAVVVGGGPNGLAAAIALARSGRSVQVIEAEATIGGGCRSAELTLPGFIHDVCSAVHRLGRSSPFFSQLPLARHGLRWIEPEVQLAHPLDDGTAIVLRDLDATAARLGPDAGAYLSFLVCASRSARSRSKALGSRHSHSWNLRMYDPTGRPRRRCTPSNNRR